MPFVIAALLLLALLFGPQFWARWVLRRHQRLRQDLDGTGGELARHLLDRFNMSQVGVEITREGDHYDPQAKVVRLSEENFHGRSLTAVAVAAHEVGHAIQDASGYRPLHMRQQLVQLAARVQKLAAVLLMALPLLAAASRSPTLGGLTILAGIASMAVGLVVHLLTLPVEWDASFRRALPILQQGYIGHRDQRAARSILTACALTYVAAALADLLNFWRWFAVLRR